MKNNIKIILAFIIGLVVAGSVSLVIAITYNASSITFTPIDNTWNVSNVQGAINDLSNISKTYKNLNTVTTATASDILNGKTAYNNLGQLITGNHSDCILGSFNCTENCHTNEGIRVPNLNFEPNIFFSIKNDYTAFTYFNKNNSNKFAFAFTDGNSTNGILTLDISDFYRFDNGLILYNWGNAFDGNSTYIACR